ncbi:phosphatase PAP2 family protein [Angustibacter luteus]|uniref:Phosphatase PAP2 family protein n=1 Tax=Angustibacter luteus TaxID=658456 RepID=A0ABW1JBB3_9ACTN
MDTLRHLDDRLAVAVNDFARHTGWLHGPALAFASYGVLLFAAPLVAGVVVSRHRGPQVLAAAGWAPLGTLLAVAVNQPIGRAVAENRPYVTHPQWLRLAARTSDFSFPSDHATMAGAVVLGLWLVSRRLGLAAAVLAVLMAFTRVYVGAHYPWDVVAGLLLGGAVSGLGWLVLRGPLTRTAAALRVLPSLRAVFAADPAAAGNGRRGWQDGHRRTPRADPRPRSSGDRARVS